MKVLLSVSLELPDFMALFSEEELHQMMFDEYANAVTCYHVDCILFGEQGSLYEGPAARQEVMMEHHKRWAKIAKDALFTVARDD